MRSSDGAPVHLGSPKVGNYAMGRDAFINALLLARCGQFAAARHLVSEAEALVSRASVPSTRADVLRTRAEVERLAGAPGQAAVSLRAALDIYQRQRATALADQVRAALASLGADQV